MGNSTYRALGSIPPENIETEFSLTGACLGGTASRRLPLLENKWGGVQLIGARDWSLGSDITEGDEDEPELFVTFTDPSKPYIACTCRWVRLYNDK